MTRLLNSYSTPARFGLIFYFLQGATLGLSATATPGPFQAFLLSQTLKNGWRSTLPTSLAPLISDIPIVTLVLLILTRTPSWLLGGLQLAGGIFILYLAWGTLSSLTSAPVAVDVNVEAARHSFSKGVLMNALSPGPYLFWSVLAGPIVLEAWRRSPGLGISFVIGFYAMLIGGFALFVVVFATASRFGPKVSLVLRVISGMALVIFGLYQVWIGTSALFTSF
jgi:threonine/homoserine/homoserine lactone efflux protein